MVLLVGQYLECTETISNKLQLNTAPLSMAVSLAAHSSVSGGVYYPAGSTSNDWMNGVHVFGRRQSVGACKVCPGCRTTEVQDTESHRSAPSLGTEANSLQESTVVSSEPWQDAGPFVAFVSLPLRIAKHRTALLTRHALQYAEP